jgi:peroxiredoxin
MRARFGASTRLPPGRFAAMRAIVLSSRRIRNLGSYRFAIAPARRRLEISFIACNPPLSKLSLVTHSKGVSMTIKVGDKLPAGTLSEYIEVEGNGCTIGPNTFKVEDLTRGKKVAIFGLPGAFTPTCSAKHVPSYLANYDKLKAKGVDDILCMSVNDAFVMGAWARDQKAGGKVRMMGDGSADYTKALGLELDLTAKGMGVRCQRFSMLVDNGVVKTLNIEGPGKFEVSGGDTMLTQAG